jgi:hypothetical protein
VSEDEPSPAKKAKVAAADEDVVKMVKKSMEFVALEDALKVDWSTEIYAKRIRRMDPSFFLLHVREFFITALFH